MTSDLGNITVMAENIQYYLDKKAINSVKLAEDLGFNYATVRNWLQGRSYPRIDKIELMANYFNITKSDLVERKKEDDTPVPELTVDEILNSVEQYSGGALTASDREMLRLIIEAKKASMEKNAK